MHDAPHAPAARGRRRRRPWSSGTWRATAYGCVNGASVARRRATGRRRRAALRGGRHGRRGRRRRASWSASAGRPTSRGSDLEAAGVRYDAHGGIVVDDHLRTTQPAHLRRRRRLLALPVHPRRRRPGPHRHPERPLRHFGRKKASALTIPWCTYTDPEVAHVGLYEHEARSSGIEVATLHRPARATSTAPSSTARTTASSRCIVEQGQRPHRRRDAGGRRTRAR